MSFGPFTPTRIPLIRPDDGASGHAMGNALMDRALITLCGLSGGHYVFRGFRFRLATGLAENSPRRGALAAFDRAQCASAGPALSGINQRRQIFSRYACVG
jgi:hypothetical protein